MTRRFFARLALTALGAGLLTPPLPAAEPGSDSPTGTIQLRSGLIARYEYHYDRNGLADALRAGDAIIALTESGNLIRLDLATLKRTLGWFGPVPVVCLGRGEKDAILAGFEDGRVCRIDPATLALTELARLPGKPQWVGALPGAVGQPANARLVAVIERIKSVTDEETQQRFEVPYSIVHDTGSNKTFNPDPGKVESRSRRATAFLLDRAGRLWLGTDNGEWGGWCCYVDLKAGKVHPVPGLKIYDFSPDKHWLGVFGFTELHDGQVWAYGGTTHMGVTDGFIWRVDRGQAEELYRRGNFPEPAPADRPYLPVTHVVEDPKTEVIRVVSFSDIYRTDARLARWEKIHTLKVRYRWGRPDAMGSYPSVRSVLTFRESGKPDSLLFVTRMDGLVSLADGQETHHPIATGQLGLAHVARIEGSSEGDLFLGYRGEERPWRFRSGAWGEVSFAPPYDPAPGAVDGQEIPRNTVWHETSILIDRKGTILTINAAGMTPGTRTTARWRDGKAEVLGREVSGLNPPACFLTPDGQLWNVSSEVTGQRADGRWESAEVLKRFTSGRWIEAARFPELQGVGRGGWIGLGWGLRSANDAGPPWILFDPRNQLLLRFTYAADFKDPRLGVIPLAQGGKPREISDAIPWAKAELLLATDQGLKTLALDGDKLAEAPIEMGARRISHLCRDGRGRLWLGGTNLAVVAATGQAPIRLDALPMMGKAPIDALAADPDHPDGVIAAISGRGVVFVRVSER